MSESRSQYVKLTPYATLYGAQEALGYDRSLHLTRSYSLCAAAKSEMASEETKQLKGDQALRSLVNP